MAPAHDSTPPLALPLATKTDAPGRAAPTHGDDPLRELRGRVTALGEALGRAYTQLHGELVPEGVGPKRLAEALGEPVPMASRILTALGCSDPIECVLRIPGPEPLRRWARAARKHGASKEASDAARGAADVFDALIVAEAGDRGRFDALLAHWVPSVRRPMELRRRQSIHRGMSELRGISCDLELTSILLHPAEDGVGVDLCCVQARTGLVHLRPGLRARFATQRMQDTPEDRLPTCLNGKPSVGALDGVRLDEFCPSPPAKVHVERAAGRLQYSLEVPGCGPNRPGGIVIAEVNRGEFEVGAPEASLPFFFVVSRVPARRLVLDVHLHPDIAPTELPELACYEAIGDGPARPGDPLRELDRLDVFEEVVEGDGPLAVRRVEGLPRYGELLDHVAGRLDWTAGLTRTYRAEIQFPVPGSEFAMIFRGARFRGRGLGAK